ncbi:hypothetical protein K525DRAFT_207554 [Schizophyllum commune Loenen D]|nr:hypothetical protein K525DRAFT_207554 [Schizophyllum commune Loenen D]
MADIIRSPSIQSFMSTDSLSMLASPTPEALATSSSALHGDDAPRATAATEFDDEPVAQSAPQAHRFYLKDGNVKFKLDDGMMYNVHRYFFDKHAPSFSHEYLCEGAEDIVALQGVSSTDLDRFLAMVYPSDIGDCDIHTVDEWTSVLRLAVKWSIPNLRARALREIEPRASPVEKVVIGREFALGKAWLLPAFVAICGARECLGYADAARLGLRTVVEIGRIREGYLIHGTVTDLAEAVRARDVLSFPSPEFYPSAGLDDGVPIATVPSGAAATSSAPVVPHPAPAAIDDTSVNSTQANAIKDHLEYLALRAAENTEMDDVCNNSLDRALYAVKLYDRLATEKSPAALRHQEWRRERLDRIYRQILPKNGRMNYKLNLSNYGIFPVTNYLSWIDDVLAPCVVHHLPAPRERIYDPEQNDRQDHLTVVFSPEHYAIKRQVKDRLLEE